MKAEWTVDDRAAWDRLAADAAWQQHWAYGAAVEAAGGRVLRCLVRDGRRPVALAQFTARSLGPFAHGAVCARGPVMVASDACPAGTTALIRRTAPLPWPRLVLLAPDVGDLAALRGAGLRRVMTGATAAMIDLAPEDGALRAAMDGKWRNRLSAAERSGGVRVTLDDAPAPAALEALAARERAQSGERRYRNLPLAVLAHYGRLAGRRALTLATAAADGAPVGQMLFVRHGRGTLYHIGWQTAEGRALGAHPLLLWRAMLALKGQGVRRLDLGMLDTRRSPGLARFKLGVGAAPITAPGVWT